MQKIRKVPASADPARALKKAKGFMIFGLKSWVKALELADGSKRSNGKYRYVVTPDASSGHIVLADGGGVVEGTVRSREEWAKIGQPARLASIALRAAKDELDQIERVEYTFNVVTGEAFLSRRGQRLADRPETISAWAEIGHPIETALFEQLTAAQEWGNKGAEDATRARMIKLGVIRPPKAEEGATTA
ncbi:MAG: hypothetical protein JSS86_11275 [Cyanobacteria bacterium SZAS LIN-2]|nr:hypothetical protein [Cyanobacteria bacterium SZAS LIN-3]MBS1996887.1 hypothetical protein [Cyanobacteria bacterium SZAS LIN-2]MBS2006920.1 hypothetical protein [Cyanobacteria bacterium SZAS TMP-1]